MKQILLSLMLLIALPCVATAQTLRTCTTLDTRTNQTSSVTGPIVQYAPSNYKAVSFVATASNSAGTLPTLDLVVESCRTSSGTCKPLVVFTQCTTTPCWTDGFIVADMNRATTNWFRYFRVASTIAGGGGTPTYSYNVEICIDTTS